MKFFATLAAALLAVCAAESVVDLTPTEYREKIDAYNNQSSSSTLILGGNEVPPGTRLFLTGLRDDRNGTTFCGGSLIAPNWILTAAHCELGTIIRYAAVGAHLVRGTRDGQIMMVEKRIRHPQYDAANYHNDFMLLRLVRSVTGIEPVALAAIDQSDEAVGTTATVMGWGRTTEGGVQSNVRLGVDVTIWDNGRCSANVGSRISEAMLCAGGELGRDSCQNDSGGPLVVQRSGKDVLVGVVSWGNGCGRLNLPGVYARVSVARDFIKKHVGAAARWL